MRRREDIEADIPPRGRHGTITIEELLLEVMLDLRDLMLATPSVAPGKKDDDD